jgi:MarR family transcriptional regulator, lower aerobic nicotinate degradation pathway regulator
MMGSAPKRPMPSAGMAEEPPYRLAEQVGHLLRRAHQRASAIFQERIGNRNLTPTQFAVLATLLENRPLSQNQLGRETAMDPATIQGVVARLRERDLIDRIPAPQDRRRFLIRLTDKGSALVDSAIADARRVTQETLAPLSREEQATFLALLRRLG